MKYLKKKKVVLLVLSLLILFGAYLRLAKLGHQSYWMDEGYTVNATLSLAEGKGNTLDSGAKYSVGTYPYFALLASYFDNSPAGYRFPSVVFGVLLIVLIYLLSKELFSTYPALLAAFFTTFSYWQIAWSRQARHYMLFTLLFYLAILFFYKFSKQKNLKNISLCLFFSVLAIWTHRLAILLPFIFLVYLFVTEKRKLDKRLMLFPLLILFFSELIFGFTIIRQLLANINFSYTLPYYLKFYLFEYHIFIFLSIFAFFSIRAKGKKTLLLLIIVGYLIVLSFLSDIVNLRYLFHLTPLFYILASYAIVDFLKTKKHYQALPAMLLLIFIFFSSGNGVLLAQDFYNLESDYHPLRNQVYIPSTPQPDWNQAYQLVKENLGEEDIIISSQAQFNKIFLQRSGYWVKYDYRGKGDDFKVTDAGTEYYVGAKVIDSLEEFKKVTKEHSGYLVVDLMAKEKMPQAITEYVKTNLEQIYHKENNRYSVIWVYQF